MPADFNKCQKEGGKIRTLSLTKSKYLHICIDKQGHSHKGEVRVKKVKK